MNEVIILADFFFSHMQGKPIIDAAGQKVGKVKDMVVLWEGATPRVTAIKFQRHHEGVLPVEAVSSFGDDAVRLAVKLEALQTKPMLDDELYVGRWLLDKQIIDLKGSKLVRVNDITLSWVAYEDKKTLILVAVDIGVRGLFRRIGLEFLVKGLNNHFIGMQYITPLEDRTSNLQLNRDKEQLDQLHPADIADLIEQMDYKSRAAFIRCLSYQQAAEAIGEMDLETRVEVIEQMDSDDASNMLEEMPPDEVADILSEMPVEKTKEILSLMEPEEAQEVRELMEYPENSAGGLMTTEYIWLSPNLTAEQAIVRLREIAPEAEMIYYLYIIDEKEKLMGVMSLRELILASPDHILGDVMNKKVITVKYHDNRRKVAETISKYGLLAIPVVNDNDRMLGIVTVDDILQLLLPERSGLDAGLLFRGSKIASRRWR